MTEDLKSLANRVISPKSAADRDALGTGRAGNPDLARRRGATSAVQPAVWSPPETIGEGVVVICCDLETIEYDLGRAIGSVVAVSVRDKQQLRWAHEPDAAIPELHTAEPLNAVGKDRPLVHAAVGVIVFQYQNAIAETEIKPLGGFGVGIILGDPESAAGVPCHGDRVPHVGLGGKNVDPETLGNTPAGRGIRRRQRSRRRTLRIRRFREVVAIHRHNEDDSRNHDQKGVCSQVHCSLAGVEVGLLDLQ